MQELSIAKDVILSITGIVGSIVAVSGLRTWKKQLKGRVEYDLSRKLLTATYKLRDSIGYIRSPFMFGGEMEDPPDSSPYAATEEGKRYYNSMTGYRKRIESANAVRAELYADLLEAEAVWGVNVRQRFDQFITLMNELAMEISSYLEDKRPPSHMHEVPKEESVRRMAIMFSRNDISKDLFAQRMDKAIISIEEVLQPKVRRLK